MVDLFPQDEIWEILDEHMTKIFGIIVAAEGFSERLPASNTFMLLIETFLGVYWMKQ